MNEPGMIWRLAVCEKLGAGSATADGRQAARGRVSMAPHPSAAPSVTATTSTLYAYYIC